MLSCFNEYILKRLYNELEVKRRMKTSKAARSNFVINYCESENILNDESKWPK